MSKNKLTMEKRALALALARQGWTHAQIAQHIGGVTRSAVTYALNRKNNPFPEVVNTIATQIVARSISAAQAAIASELRKIANELEKPCA